LLGSLRLALAVAVVVFHAGWWPFGLRIGVCAVAVFYLISGYAMSGLAGRFLAVPPGGFGAGVVRFWRDRWLRLYPQYALWAGVGAVVAMGFGRRWLFQGGGLDTLNVLANVTVIPLSLYMYLPSVAKMMWLPQAWSLGTELCFYAVFPLIWRSRAVAWAAAVCGWLVLALAMSGVLDPDWYGYRLLPGTLPFFLLGRAMFTRDRAMMSALLVLLAGLGVFVVATSRLGLGYNRELLLAALAGPALLALALRVPAWRHDAVLGHVSYGTYLAHICVLAMLFDVHSLAARAVAGAVLAVAGGGLGWWLVERPVLRLRRRLRG